MVSSVITHNDESSFKIKYNKKKTATGVRWSVRVVSSYKASIHLAILMIVMEMWWNLWT